MQVARRLGAPTPDLRRYTAGYDSEFTHRSWQSSSKKELVKAISKADVVYASDFHAFAQSQRMHLRLLRSLSSSQPLILCCEFLEAQHQNVIERFLADRISEKKFLRDVRWHQWGFPWDHYGPILQLARQRHWKVYGINMSSSDATLIERDRFSAQKLAAIRRAYPDALQYVIFGELHIAEKHLPQQFRRHYRQPLKEILIFQDVEKIYFQLVRRNLESRLDVVRSGSSRFCVLEAPPWVKWQSYQMYLEKTYDRDLDDLNDPMEFGDHVKEMIRLLNHDFGVQTPMQSLAVYSSRDRRVWASLKRYLNSKDLPHARRLMALDRSFYIPNGDVFYLSRESVNHAAELAGKYLHSFLSDRKDCLWNMPKHFLPLIWTEAVGFFASKLVNHKRAAETLPDLCLQLSDEKLNEQRREILALALEQRLRERLMIQGGKSLRRKIYPRRKVSYLEAARLLGSMMGEKMYQSYRRRSISQKTMLAWLRQDVLAPEFSRFYFNVIQRLEAAAGTEKTRSERV